MKSVLFSIILLAGFSCSSNESKTQENPIKIPKKSEPKEVQVLKESLIGESNSKSFTSVNGEFYVIGKYKNDCNKYFSNGINCVIEPTRDPDGIKRSHYFTSDELNFGESIVDTLRVFSEPDSYYIRSYMAAGCKLDFEVIDIQ